jgi:hypothetical protein
MITNSSKLERIQRNRFFQELEYHYGNLLENLNLLVMRVRHHHSDDFFLIHFLMTLDVGPLSSKQLAFMFLLGTYVALPRSVDPPATALQLEVFLLLIQCVNLQIFLETNA